MLNRRTILYIVILLVAISCRDDGKSRNISFPEVPHEKGTPMISRLDSQKQTYLEVLKIADATKSRRFNAVTSGFWGAVCLDRKEYTEAMRLFRKAAVLAKRQQLDILYANSLRNIARIYLLLSHPDSAVCYYLKAQEVVAATDAVTFMDISAELFVISRYTDNWEMAKDEMLNYRSTQATDGMSSHKTPNGLFINRSDFARGRNHSLKSMDKETFKIKDYRTFALEYQEHYVDIFRMNEHLQGINHDLRDKYHHEILKSENQRIRNELLWRKVWMLSVLIVVLVIFCSGMIVFYFYRRQIHRKMNFLVSRLEENEERLCRENGLSDEERLCLKRDNKELSRRIKELSIRQKDKDKWNSYLQEQIQGTNRQLNEFKEASSFLSSTDVLALTQFYQLRNQPEKVRINKDEEWEAIFHVIDRFYGDISTKLIVYKLGLQELRICYLIRAGFPNVMIANISCVTTDAIAKSKQRMKVKFALTPRDSFDDFIREL